MDFIGPLPGPPNARFGLALCDLYSRWPEVVLCADATAATVVEFLDSLFSREGLPESIISDNGPQFRSRELQQFLGSVGVKHVFSSPYSPQTCGMVERLNRTVKGAFQAARLSGQSRAAYLRRFLREYRTTKHPATGCTPFLLMRGREMRTALDVLPAEKTSAARERDAKVRPRVAAYQGRYKARHDRRARRPAWKAGDWVRVRHPVTRKLEGREPVQIAEQTGPVSYRLSTGERVHARRLAPGLEPTVAPGREQSSEHGWSPIPDTQSDTSEDPGPLPSPAGTPRRGQRVCDRESPPPSSVPRTAPALRRSDRERRPPVHYSP